jgi:hypothetical protein
VLFKIIFECLRPAALELIDLCRASEGYKGTIRCMIQTLCLFDKNGLFHESRVLPNNSYFASQHAFCRLYQNVVLLMDVINELLVKKNNFFLLWFHHLKVLQRFLENVLLEGGDLSSKRV